MVISRTAVSPAPRLKARVAPGSGRPRPVAGGLVASGAPPFRLPGLHFAFALSCWLLAAAGLVWVAPALASGDFTATRVLLVTHLFTLGWVTTTILGALYQFLPVALGVPIRSERTAFVTLALYAPGLLLFLGGLFVGATALVVAGAGTFGTGLLLFVVNLAATLKRSADRSVTWWALLAAGASLLATIVLGAALTGNLRWGYLADHRLLALGVHLHIAIIGWVFMVMVGVAHKLLPMFLLTHGASERPARVAVAATAAGVALLLFGHHALTPGLTALIALLIGGGVAAFLVQAALFFRHRRKPRLDPGLRLAAGGLVMLGAALLLAPAFLTRGVTAPALAVAYVTAMILAISLFVAGHYYKILPFLVWYHRFGPLAGKQPVPHVAGLYASRPGNAAAALLVTGALGLLATILTGAADLARLPALVFAIGAAIVAAQMFSISRRRPE